MAKNQKLSHYKNKLCTASELALFLLETLSLTENIMILPQKLTQDE